MSSNSTYKSRRSTIRSKSTSHGRKSSRLQPPRQKRPSKVFPSKKKGATAVSKRNTDAINVNLKQVNENDQHKSLESISSQEASLSDSSLTLNHSYKFNTKTAIKMYSIRNFADIKQIESTFDEFETLLKVRREECLKQAKLMLATVKSPKRKGTTPKHAVKFKFEENETKHETTTTSNKIETSAKTNKETANIVIDSNNDSNIIYIDSNYVCNVISNIGIDFSHNLYNIRKLTNDCVLKMKRIINIQKQIDRNNKQLNKKKAEYPRIANEINRIKLQLKNNIRKPKLALKSARNRMNKIKNRELNNVRALPKPHRLLVKTIKACAILSNQLDANDLSLIATNSNSKGLNSIVNDIETQSVAMESNSSLQVPSMSTSASYSNLHVRIESSNIAENWIQIRKLLKPSFIQNLIQFKPKNIQTNVKELIKTDYLGVDSDANLVELENESKEHNSMDSDLSELNETSLNALGLGSNNNSGRISSSSVNNSDENNRFLTIENVKKSECKCGRYFNGMVAFND